MTDWGMMHSKVKPSKVVPKPMPSLKEKLFLVPSRWYGSHFKVDSLAKSNTSSVCQYTDAVCRVSNAEYSSSNVTVYDGMCFKEQHVDLGST